MTKGIFEDDGRPIRAGSCGKPSVNESLAGRVIVVCLYNMKRTGAEDEGEDVAEGEDEEVEGGEGGEGDGRRAARYVWNSRQCSGK